MFRYQADLKKATFYYTADGRVDFRDWSGIMPKNFALKLKCGRSERGRNLPGSEDGPLRPVVLFNLALRF